MITQIMRALMILCALYIASASATSCPHPCKCFTTRNGIQAANCTDLPDQMTTTWPQKILQIHFNSNRTSPVMLKNNAFKHFPQLTYMDITGGAIQYVGNFAFNGLSELVELNLVDTDIKKLHPKTFVNNRKLAFLSLRKNPRLIITPSFLISNSISELDLSECGLSTLKSVYFKSLPNMKYLFAMRNKLKTLGSQFGPAGLKYVNLAHNHIENIYEDLETYKRLRTINLVGNPINCTCELSDIDKRLMAKGVAFGNSITCENTGKPLGELIEVCSDKEMMGDDPVDMYKAEALLKIDDNAIQSRGELDDAGSGSGSGDGELEPIMPQNNSYAEEVKNTLPVEEVKNATAVEEVNIATAVEEVKNATAVEEVTGNVTAHTGIIAENVTPAGNTVENGPTPVEEIIVTKTKTGKSFAEPPPSSSAPEIGPPSVEPATSTTTVTADVPSAVSTAATAVSTAATAVVVVENTSHPTKDEDVRVSPPVPTAADNNSSTGIVPNPIQAPKDDEPDVQTKVAEFLKTNVGVTWTAAILAVVIIAIVYKAVCVGRSRSRRAETNDDGKSVELKDVKYTEADTEDSHEHTPVSSVEENLLEDHGDSEDDSDDDDDDDDHGDRDRRPYSAPANNGQSGLLNSVMDAVKNGEPAKRTPPDVPTRVIVKMVETPKASKPITINNAQR